MGANAQTTATFNAALLEVNMDHELVKMFSEGRFTMDMMQKGEFGQMEDAGIMADDLGKWLQIHAHTAGNLNAGIGVAEGFSYPRPGHQTIQKLQYTDVKSVAATARTSEAMDKSSSNTGAVFTVASIEMEALIENCRKRENINVLGDGSGVISLIADGNMWDNGSKKLTVPDGTKYTVDEHIIIRHLTTGALGGEWEKTTVRTVEEAKPAKVTVITGNDITITYVDDAAVVEGAQDEFEDHGVYMHDEQGKTPWGLAMACSTANPSYHGYDPASLGTFSGSGMNEGFGGIDRLTNDWWQAYVVAAGGANVSLQEHIAPMSYNLIKRVPHLLNKDDAIMSVSSWAIWNSLLQQAEAGRQTVDRKKIDDYKYDLFRWSGITFGYDPDMIASTMYFFSPESIFRMVKRDWSYEQSTHAAGNQLAGGYGQPVGEWQKNLTKTGQTIFTSVRGFGAITGLAA